MGIKISTIIDEGVWEEVKDLSKETHQKLSRVVTEALKDYVRKKRVRPEFLKHLQDSTDEHEELGKLLAR